MPKVSNKIDYSTTPISFYRFCCNDVNITSCYVGHTANFRKRKNSHKNACTNSKNRAYNFKIYQTIRENAGWGNWSMIEIESKICLSKRDAERYEQLLTEKLAADMNMHKAFGNKTEYRKQYRDDHKEEIKQQKKQYNQDHKEQKKQSDKQYRDDHKEEIKQYHKQYRDDHKEEINKPIKCECGCMITKSCLTRHKKTKKHINLMCVTI